jgi:hypothetical protein
MATATMGAADDASAGAASSRSAAEEGGSREEEAFPLHRCLPARPSYYEDVAPRVPSIERALLASGTSSDDEFESSSDDDSDDDDGDMDGHAALLQLIEQLQNVPAGQMIETPNGAAISAADLLGILHDQAQHAAVGGPLEPPGAPNLGLVGAQQQEELHQDDDDVDNVVQ